jgi:hypothetical protein
MEQHYNVYLNIENVVIYEGQTDFLNFETLNSYYINPTNSARPFYLTVTKDENVILLQEASTPKFVGVPKWRVLLNRKN